MFFQMALIKHLRSLFYQLKRDLKDQLHLRLKVHPPQQVLEARVVAEGVRASVYIEKDQTAITFLVGLLEPFKRLVLFAKLGMQYSNARRYHVLLLRSLFRVIQRPSPVALFVGSRRD